MSGNATVVLKANQMKTSSKYSMLNQTQVELVWFGDDNQDMLLCMPVTPVLIKHKDGKG